MDSKSLLRIHVKGYVQGVGFRWNAAMEAKSLGITGFVKNLDDGSVYVEAEGSKQQLDIFVEWCRSGPGRSRVKSVETEELPSAGYTEFNISH
jgi:acylphosphatase